MLFLGGLRICYKCPVHAEADPKVVGDGPEPAHDRISKPLFRHGSLEL